MVEWKPCQNNITKPVNVSTFLSPVKKDQPVKNIVFTTNTYYLWMGIDFKGIIL